MHGKPLVLAAVLAVLLLAPDARAQEVPRAGGVLKVASIGEPPTLDIPMSTAVVMGMSSDGGSPMDATLSTPPARGTS